MDEKKVVKNENIKNKDEISKNSKVFYGNCSDVINVGHLDYNDFVKQTRVDQKMLGFDNKYTDFVEYIIKITHEIWEQKGIGIIYDTYHNNVTMHCGSINLVGIKDVIANTLQTLHAFPDRRLIGQDVIWSRNEGSGYFSSHRVMSTATNLGESNFGIATNKKINFRTVIDCLVENNRIYEEWLVRDNLWIVTQLGFDPHELAKTMASKLSANDIQKSYGICEAMEGQYMPLMYSAKDNSVGEVVLEMLSRIYNYKYINEVKKYYHENSVVHFICDKDLNGYDEIQGMIISLIASVPNGSFEVDRVTYNDSRTSEEFNVAVRWRLRGINEGIGYFGKPSGNPINIMGISHFKIIDNKVLEEWITFDGLDVLKQMYIGTTNLSDKGENNE